jgi:hypothetical protein
MYTTPATTYESSVAVDPHAQIAVDDEIEMHVAHQRAELRQRLRLVFDFAAGVGEDVGFIQQPFQQRGIPPNDDLR